VIVTFLVAIPFTILGNGSAATNIRAKNQGVSLLHGVALALTTQLRSPRAQHQPLGVEEEAS
jgi:hypothetical protein